MSAHFAAIGAFGHATLAWFNPDIKGYDYIPVNEQVEVASLVGNIATYQGEPRLHAHASVARRDGSAMGGHIIEAFVRPTLEIVVTELSGQLERKQDGESALPLLSL
jgi:predicted DNA-binding protein with PD1-like motif